MKRKVRRLALGLSKKQLKHHTRVVLVKQKLEKEEQERIELEEMDEESYEALPEKRRREIDSKLLYTKKLRLKR
jgi:hypothetical protein